MRELRGAYIWDHRDHNDGSICVLPAGELRSTDPDNDDVLLGYLVLTYYKNRGTTSGARLVNDDKPDAPLTLVVAEHILKGLGIAP
jgi:hypothetical protein